MTLRSVAFNCLYLRFVLCCAGCVIRLYVRCVAPELLTESAFFPFFQAIAKLVMPEKAWAYYSSAADDEITNRENHLAYHRCVSVAFPSC